jgi:hypothetical protein
MTTIIVLAKSPVPGRVKTRMCPPLTNAEAAAVAEAALRDTLAVTTAVHGARTVLALDGERGSWLPSGVRVIPQRGSGLAERIASAFGDTRGPALLIGMDTPQVSRALLTNAIQAVREADAVLGMAADGGWWAAGLRRSVPGAFAGVPMSTAVTGERQLMRFDDLGLRVAALPVLRDVDTFEDAMKVAREAPHTRFARTVDALASKVVGSRA